MGSRYARPGVVVGVDETTSGRHAVRAAAAEATRRGLPLRILHVVRAEPAGALPRARYRPGAVGGAADLLADAADAARSILAGVEPTTEVLFGDAVEQLTAWSDGAELVVVGHGRGGLLHDLLGSVAFGVMTHAHCPVLVIGDGWVEEETGGSVVVGVDGRAGTTEVLEAAFAEAQLTGSDLVAVHAWHFPMTSGPGDMLPLVYDPAQLEREERDVLNDALEPVRAKFPAVRVTELVPKTTSVRGLLEASAGARMLVLGTRGRGPLTGLLLGSTGRAALRHATAPVLVVRPHEEPS